MIEVYETEVFSKATQQADIRVAGRLAKEV